MKKKKKRKKKCGFWTGPTQTELYKLRRLVEAGHFRFRKMNYAVCVAKTKVLIRFGNTAKLISAFDLAYKNIGFLMTRLICYPFELPSHNEFLVKQKHLT